MGNHEPFWVFYNMSNWSKLFIYNVLVIRCLTVKRNINTMMLFDHSGLMSTCFQPSFRTWRLIERFQSVVLAVLCQRCICQLEGLFWPRVHKQLSSCDTSILFMQQKCEYCLWCVVWRCWSERWTVVETSYQFHVVTMRSSSWKETETSSGSPTAPRGSLTVGTAVLHQYHLFFII